tara:strand:+ start:419 stop:589 length:171 start_codon:yes stop_codon:yes gene_type:complete
MRKPKDGCRHDNCENSVKEMECDRGVNQGGHDLPKAEWDIRTRHARIHVPDKPTKY